MEEKDATPEYLKGFNNGYLLAEHEPGLIQQLEKSLDKSSDYAHGLKMGKKQRDREILLQQLKQSQEQNKQKDLGR
ncbi:hypothetical protein A4D02_26460 [Niastella koreensis]|uniref:Uncharacterized protein n=2 Tax=Niastella koreensis TaxID=354356 RepID=G8TJI5_NIAKG|nr:hypothetical protein [Niastella koreensis]AEV99720.1 hypothetical protein Niako_3415 [Niastella koreensis GR20-10]OQP51654.1 hypothetical protein A4D02_26460 [Niastella koreensis]